VPDSDDTLQQSGDVAPEPAETDSAPASEAPAPGAADVPTTDAAEPKPSKGRFLFPWKTVIALAVVVILGLPVYSTLQPQYYDRYPQLRGRIAAWKVSTHGKIPCYGCHMDPGAWGFVVFAARSVPEFYSQLVFGPGPQNLLSTPDTAACQKCHTDYRTISPAGDLLIPHKAHVEVLHIACPTCHKNLVHSLNAQGFNTPEMQTCLTLCHNGVKATNQCDKCHTRKQVPPGHLNKNWLVIHPTMVDKINCAQCHAWSPNYCRECHSHRPPTHVGNWKFNHQFEAKQRGTKGCLFCHGQAFCNKCH
jgi:hypothetical protein